MMAIVRGLVELLSRGRVLRRRLPDRFGRHTIYVSPDASLRFWRRDLERADPGLLALVPELVARGSCVWDIGANVGLFAMAAADSSGSDGAVLAVEADPFLVELLRRSGAELPATCASVEVVHAAAAERVGVSAFSIARRARAASHLASVRGSSQSGGSRKTMQVPSVTLDHLLRGRRRPDVLKIDVEGSELLCLRGAPLLLREVRPILLCEVSEPNAQGVGVLLHEAGYELLDASVPLQDRRPRELPAWNTLALPRGYSAIEVRRQ
jgi:FkbM family methyltransferase